MAQWLKSLLAFSEDLSSIQSIQGSQPPVTLVLWIWCPLLDSSCLNTYGIHMVRTHATNKNLTSKVLERQLTWQTVNVFAFIHQTNHYLFIKTHFQGPLITETYFDNHR